MHLIADLASSVERLNLVDLIGELGVRLLEVPKDFLDSLARRASADHFAVHEATPEYKEDVTYLTLHVAVQTNPHFIWDKILG